MTHQANLFILLFGALQGFLLSAWMLRHEKSTLQNIYLAAFLIVVSLQLTFKVVTKTWVTEYALIPYAISYKLPYLIGPLLYLFAGSQRGKAWRPLDLIHFFPFVFFIAIEFLWPGPGLHAYAQAAFQAISLSIYAFLALLNSDKHLKRFIVWAAATEFIIILTIAVMFVYYGRFPDVRLLFVVLTILIYWITFKVLSRSGPFFKTAVVMSLPEKNLKYAHSSLKAEEAGRILNKLTSLMQEEKLFTDSCLSIESLASRLQSSRHHVSQVINERLHKTYGDYINELRLEEARRRLSDPSNLRFTIASIALDSGFSSVSSFNESFKRNFLITPSQYRQQALKSKSA